MNKFFTIIFLLALVSCASTPKKILERSTIIEHIKSNEEMMDEAQANSSTEGRRVLDVSRSMISNQSIVIGGCWNFVNSAYDQAGFLSKNRATIFKSKFKGPYSDTELILPGDWLYFVNHTYKDTEHSAIFIGWINFEEQEALMASYVGGNKRQPATYKSFRLNNVYNIIRGK